MEYKWNSQGSESTKIYSFFRGKCNNSFHGVGFITKSNSNCQFQSFSNRLVIEYNNGRTHPLNITNTSAPTSNSSITEIDYFYTTLESIINKVNKKEMILCRDFNIQIENIMKLIRI